MNEVEEQIYYGLLQQQTEEMSQVQEQESQQLKTGQNEGSSSAIQIRNNEAVM